MHSSSKSMWGGGALGFWVYCFKGVLGVTMKSRGRGPRFSFFIALL
jgi:hypothetical protein